MAATTMNIVNIVLVPFSQYFVNLLSDWRTLLQIIGSCELVQIAMPLVKGVFLGCHLEYVYIWHNITSWIKLKTLNLGTFPEKWCQPRLEIQYKGTELDNLLITNLASKMVAKLSFQSNSEFIGQHRAREDWISAFFYYVCKLSLVIRDKACPINKRLTLFQGGMEIMHS